MRRSPGAAPVGASDRKVRHPIGRCDGGARGTRGRASYLRFRHPRPFSLRSVPFPLAPSRSHARGLSLALDPAASLSHLRRLARDFSVPLFRRLAKAALFPQERLCCTHAPDTPSPRAPHPVAVRSTSAPPQTHGISAADRLTGLSTAARANRRRRRAAASLPVATRSSRGADRASCRVVGRPHRVRWTRACTRVTRPCRARFSLPHCHEPRNELEDTRYTASGSGAVSCW